MPQHQSHGEKQPPKTTQDGPLASHPPQITFPWRRNAYTRRIFCRRIRTVRTEETGCCYYILGFSLCPCALCTDLFYFLRDVLRVLKLIVLGEWAFDRLFFPNTHLCLSEKLPKTHAMPFLISRPSYVLFQQLTALSASPLALQAAPAHCQHSASLLWSAS